MKEILKSFANGEISLERCETLLKAQNVMQLDEIANFDTSRTDRTGFPEAILAESKSYDDLLHIIKRFFEKELDDDGNIELSENIIITRLSKERYKLLMNDLSCFSDKNIKFDYNENGKILIIYQGSLTDINPDYGKIGIVTAGTSDIPIAEEDKNCH